MKVRKPNAYICVGLRTYLNQAMHLSECTLLAKFFSLS